MYRIDLKLKLIQVYMSYCIGAPYIFASAANGLPAPYRILVLYKDTRVLNGGVMDPK